MSITIGGKIPQSISIGGKAVASLSINGEVVWPDTPSGPDYFYIETLEQRGRSTVLKHGTPTSGSDLSYSFDKETWTPVTYDANNRFDIMVEAGEKLYLRSSTGLSESDSNWYYFGSDSHFNVGGDIRTLLDYTDSTLSTAPQYCFYHLFNSATNMISAANLDLSGFTIIEVKAFMETFRDCRSLTTAPTLPDAELEEYCYYAMFRQCSSLTSFPPIPDVRRKNVLQRYQYGAFLFNCGSINNITTYVTQWDTNIFSSWVYGVAATGDFYNLGQATIPTGTNGIPAGWTEHTTL